MQQRKKHYLCPQKHLKNNRTMGSYSQDAAFLRSKGITFKELCSGDGLSRVIVVPAWGGRVATSSAAGIEGDSFGWLNYRFIGEGKFNKQFNNYGGEERFWLGPEGGPFSLYFKEGAEQVFENWKVPDIVDHEAFEIEKQSSSSVTLSQKAGLKNTQGMEFNFRMTRKVTLKSRAELAQSLGVELSPDLKVVAYQSENTVTNLGPNEWQKEGTICIWMLCQFKPSPTTKVMIPYRDGADGPIVNDTYFGVLPKERLQARDGVVYFQIDGKLRSKIGIPPQRAKGLIAGYDEAKGLLTLLTYNTQKGNFTYLNSQWGKQQNPFNGDAINAYNDGPLEDGSIMGPFYEIETSSPAIALQPNASFTHAESVIHIQGTPAMMKKIISEVVK